MIRIALIDDNVVYLQHIRQIVEACAEFIADMVCDTCSSGLDLSRSDSGKYQLVILDMQMEIKAETAPEWARVPGRDSVHSPEGRPVYRRFNSGKSLPVPGHTAKFADLGADLAGVLYTPCRRSYPHYDTVNLLSRTILQAKYLPRHHCFIPASNESSQQS